MGCLCPKMDMDPDQEETSGYSQNVYAVPTGYCQYWQYRRNRGAEVGMERIGTRTSHLMGVMAGQSPGESYIRNRIRLAKRDGRFVTIQNGELYIDYQYICRLPADYCDD